MAFIHEITSLTNQHQVDVEMETEAPYLIQLIYSH